MKPEDIITVSDLLAFEKRIVGKFIDLIQEMKGQQSTGKPHYLRSKGARELLKVSENTLRSMRENGDIPFSFIGKTYYYPKQQILKILENNTINKSK